MRVETVTAEYVNQPKNPGGKYGSINVGNKRYINVPVNMLSQFTKGGQYEIEVITQTWGDRDVEVLKKVNYVSGGTNGAAPQQQSRMGGGNADTPMQIFITGIVGRAMGSGKFGPQDVEPWTLAALDAYRALNRRIAQLKREAEDGPQDEPE
jgi:hypothetical protein